MTPATGPGHERWADSAAAYVLHALPAEELEAFDAHLAECAVCRAEVDELAPAVAALPASVRPVAPPPALRDRLMAEVGREATLLAAAAGTGDSRPQRRPRRAWRGFDWRVGALAAATLLLGVVGGLAAAGGLGGGGARTVAMVAQGAGKGAQARLVIDDGHATLVANRLPEPPAGRVYQVWVKPRGQDPRPTTSLFVPRADGTATVAVPDDAAGAEAVLVSTEPPGGSPAPTSAPVLVGSPS